MWISSQDELTPPPRGRRGRRVALTGLGVPGLRSRGGSSCDSLCRAPSLESLALDFLPRRYLSAACAAQLAREEIACAICLEAYAEGAEVACMPCSGLHKAHWHCLRQWLCRCPTCPTCRWDLSLSVAQAKIDAANTEHAAANTEHAAANTEHAAANTEHAAANTEHAAANTEHAALHTGRAGANAETAAGANTETAAANRDRAASNTVRPVSNAVLAAISDTDRAAANIDRAVPTTPSSPSTAPPPAPPPPAPLAAAAPPAVSGAEGWAAEASRYIAGGLAFRGVDTGGGLVPRPPFIHRRSNLASGDVSRDASHPAPDASRGLAADRSAPVDASRDASRDTSRDTSRDMSRDTSGDASRDAWAVRGVMAKAEAELQRLGGAAVRLAAAAALIRSRCGKPGRL